MLTTALVISCISFLLIGFVGGTSNLTSLKETNLTFPAKVGLLFSISGLFEVMLEEIFSKSGPFPSDAKYLLSIFFVSNLSSNRNSVEFDDTNCGCRESSSCVSQY